MNYLRTLAWQNIIGFLAGTFLTSALVVFFTFFPLSKLPFWRPLWGGLLEEGIKWAAALWLIRKMDFKPISILSIGAGFAVSEAFVRFLSTSRLPWQPVVAHMVFAFVMATFFFFYKKEKKPAFKFIHMSAAVIVPVWIHLFYNVILIAKLV
jgi:hypothetical protein